MPGLPIFKRSILLIFLLSAFLGAAQGYTVFTAKNIKKPDTAEVNRYSRLALKQVRHISQNMSKMKLYIDSAETVCLRNKIDFPSLLHFARAYYFFYAKDYKHASQEAAMTLKLARNEMDEEMILRSLIFFGRYYAQTGLLDESIKYFNEAISLAEKEHKQKYSTAIYSGMTYTYRKLGKMKEMRASLKKLIAAAERNKDSVYLKEGYWTLGTSYMDLDIDNRKGDSLVRKGLRIAYMTNDSLNIALSLANLGWNFYLQHIWDSAVVYYNKSLFYSLPARIYRTSANAFGNLGTIYRDLGINKLALKYYKKAIDEAEKGKQKDIYTLWWVNRDMSEMFLKAGDTAKAYLSYVEFKNYHDIYLKSENSQGLEDAKIRYEADVENKELELLSLRVKSQRIIIIGSTGLFILIVAVFILLLSRAKIIAKKKISEMNRQISEITQANLRQQMNPHFIFNTLNSIQYYMYQHDKLATNNYLTKFSSLMRKVLENSQHTSVPLSDELDALNLYLELEKIRFKDKFDYSINVDDEIDAILYKVPTMLIQPYVENSICHGLVPAKDKGMISIDLKLKKDYIACTIQDNGIGREAALAKKNGMMNNHQSIGTQIVNSRLELVNALYGSNFKTIYTDLKDEEGKPEGTRVEIHIPILT